MLPVQNEWDTTGSGNVVFVDTDTGRIMLCVFTGHNKCIYFARITLCVEHGIIFVIDKNEYEKLGLDDVLLFKCLFFFSAYDTTHNSGQITGKLDLHLHGHISGITCHRISATAIWTLKFRKKSLWNDYLCKKGINKVTEIWETF